MSNQIFRGLYQIDKQIAQGGFANIYRATFAKTQSPVILKACRCNDSRYIQSITAEARLLDRFNHPHIVQLNRIPRDRSGLLTMKDRFPHSAQFVPFFVLDYLSGGSLQDYIEAFPRLTMLEALAIVYPIVHALCYVHAENLTHNDIKPDNIMFQQPLFVGQPFRPILIDFGIARRVLQSDAGSHPWMAPEQLRQTQLIDPPELRTQLDPSKVDVWGIGVLLYRILGGRMPFHGRKRNALTQQILENAPTTLNTLGTHISRDFERLILEGCMAKRPQDRITMQTLERHLREWDCNQFVARTPSKRWRLWWWN